jgi:hypothetical protein
MNHTPGFTAHLCEGQYFRYGRRQGAGWHLIEQRSVTPQRWIPTGGCIPNCVCIGPDECPCCQPGDPGWPLGRSSFASLVRGVRAG